MLNRGHRELSISMVKHRHSSIYAVNVGDPKEKLQEQKPRKLRLLRNTKGEENRIEL